MPNRVGHKSVLVPAHTDNKPDILDMVPVDKRLPVPGVRFDFKVSEYEESTIGKKTIGTATKKESELLKEAKYS